MSKDYSKISIKKVGIARSNAHFIQVSAANPSLEKHKTSLLLRLREHYQNAAIPMTALYEMTALRGNPVKPSQYVWQKQCTDGRESFGYRLVGNDLWAAQELLEEGTLVKSFTRHVEGGPTVTRIQPLEDINWGMDRDGLIHMFRLSEDQNVPDDIPALNEAHDNTIHIILQRLDDGMAIVDDREILLSNGVMVSPILFGKDKALIHNRHLKLQR